jgi:1-acyl-sn-glycerol-3-phosphate acyltransferase
MYGLLRWLMRTVVHTYLVGGLFEVRGLDNIPRSGPLIVCPNHSATLDPPLVPAFVPRSDTWSMAKSEYFKGGIGEWFFREYHAFPVVRHTADRAAVRRSFDLLEQGHVLVMYPEGTRVESGLLAEPEPGAGFIAQRSRALVVPVGLTGTRECLPKGAKWPRRTHVSITFGRPYRVGRQRPDGSKVSFGDAAEAIMLSISELLPPEQRGAFSDLDRLRKRLAGIAQYE